MIKRFFTCLSFLLFLSVLFLNFCFANNTNKENLTAIGILNTSQKFYHELKDYSADFTMSVNLNNRGSIKGKIFFKSPDLLRIEYKDSFLKQEDENLVVVDNVNYVIIQKTMSKSDTEIHHSDGRISKIKKGEPYTSVMLYGPDFKKAIFATEEMTLSDIELADLWVFLTVFQPGYVNRNLLFPFESFKKYYEMASLTKSKFDNQKDVYIVEGIIKDKSLISVQNKQYRLPKSLQLPSPLPFKARCFIDMQGFICKLETIDANDKQMSFVEYRNTILNKGIEKNIFDYEIPQNAFVMDMASDLKWAYEQNIENKVKDNNSSEDYKKLGDSYKAQNKNIEALEAYKKALSLEPNMVGAHIGVGNIYARLKEYEKAVGEFDLAIKINPEESIEAMENTILIYLLKNDESAIDYFRILKKTNIPSAEAMKKNMMRARFFGIQEVDGGFDIVMSMNEPVHKEIMPYIQKADTFIAQSQYEEAINTYKESLKEKETAVAHYAIGKIYELLNKSQEAITHLDKAVQLKPNDNLLRLELINVYGLYRDSLNALKETKKLLEKEPLNKIGLFYQGQIYFRSNQYKEAKENWDKLKQVDKILFGLIEDDYEEAVSMNAGDSIKEKKE